MATIAPASVIVVFDGNCGFCSSVVRWLGRLDWRRRLVFVPAQARGLPEVTGIDASELGAVAWAITPDCRRLRGPAAILAALDQLMPASTPLATALLSLPCVRWLAEATYLRVARARSGLPGSAALGEDGAASSLAADIRRELRRRCAGGSEPPAIVRSAKQ